MASALQYSPWQSVGNVLLGQLSFYLAQWEEYHSNHFLLPYLNVTEALVMSELVLLITAWQGPQFWVTSGLGNVIFYIILLSAVWSNGGFVYNTLTKYMKPGEMVHSLTLLLGPLQLAALGTVWAATSSIQILTKHPHLWANTLGFIFAGLVGRIVLARIVMEKMSASQLLLVPVYIVVFNDARGSPLFDARWGAYALLAIAIAAYVHFAMYVITELCARLKIRCLHIPYNATTPTSAAATHK